MGRRGRRGEEEELSYRYVRERGTAGVVLLNKGGDEAPMTRCGRKNEGGKVMWDKGWRSDGREGKLRLRRVKT